jgi:hypothetical protein
LPAAVIIGYWVLSDKEFENRATLWCFLLVPIWGIVLIKHYVVSTLLLSGLIIMLIFLKDVKEISLRDEKQRKPVIFIILLVATAVCFSVFRFINIIFQISPIMLYIVGACIAIPIILYAVFFITRFSTTLFNIRVYMRIVTRGMISVGLVLLTLIPFIYIIMIRGIVTMSLDDVLSFALLSKVFLYIVEKKYDDINKGYTKLTQYKVNVRTLLFLRKFSYELNNDACLSSISKHIYKKYQTLQYNIIAIADPRLLYCYEGFACNFIFLPSVNWKKHVREYIKTSTLVVAVLDSSEGVFWEVFNNSDYRYKYIYYLPSHDTLTKIITHHYFKQYEEESLGKYLLNLSLTAESNSIQFPLYIHWDGFSFCKDGDVANILDRKIQNGDLS